MRAWECLENAYVFRKLKSCLVWFLIDTEASVLVENTFCPQKYDIGISQIPQNLPHCTIHESVKHKLC
jgi:hypothetical protein